MIKFNLDILKTKVYYALKTNSLSSENWEQIICDSLGAIWIEGDKYLADGILKENNLNIKTIHFHPQIRTTKPSRDFIHNPEHYDPVLELVQRRVGLPHLNDMIEDPYVIGKATIENFKRFERESFEKFNTTKTLDVIIRHGIDRTEKNYLVDVFVEDHIHPDADELDWIENLHGVKSKYKGRQSVIGVKNNKKIIARNSSGTGRQQNCYLIFRDIRRIEHRETIKLPIPERLNYEHNKLLEEILCKSVDK